MFFLCQNVPRTSGKDSFGAIAQLVEQMTFNHWVQGSSPCGPTRIKTPPSAVFLFRCHEDENPSKATKWRGVRPQVDFASVAQRNRYGSPAAGTLCRARESLWPHQNKNTAIGGFFISVSRGREPIKSHEVRPQVLFHFYGAISHRD